MTESLVTTQPASAADQYVSDFVDRWDELIDWDRRRAGEGEFFTGLLREAGAHRVLDAAAGTGYHAVQLARAGFDVTAVDVSDEMIRRTAANAGRHGQRVRAVRADWRELDTAVEGKFDAIVCLGSSFPHLFDEQDRVTTLARFHDKLVPNGLLILDHRNFDAIRRHQYRASGKYYYCGSSAAVSVGHIDDDVCQFVYRFADRATYRLEVYPILQAECRELITRAGFGRLTTFGDFAPIDDPLVPDFVVHVATRT